MMSSWVSSPRGSHSGSAGYTPRFWHMLQGEIGKVSFDVWFRIGTLPGYVRAIKTLMDNISVHGSEYPMFMSL